jgi:hypothetical protein
MMKRPEFLYHATQIFKTFAPLTYHDLIIPPEIAALPDALLLPFLREAALRMRQKKEGAFCDFYTFHRNPDSALGYELVDLDLTCGEQVLDVFPEILQSHQNPDGVRLSPLINAFMQEMEPCQMMEEWIEGVLKKQGGEVTHAFL